MKIVFYHSDKPREELLANAFADGARSHGEEVVLRRLTEDKVVAEECTLACMVGVKSRELFWNHWRAGIHTLYFDKGYSRHALSGPVKIWEYWRVAVDSHQPTLKFQKVKRPSDRRDKLGFSFEPWRSVGETIVIAGSSAKYHEFYGMKDPTRVTEKIIRKIKSVSGREIIYRPKPSWKDARPIRGATFSSPAESIEDVLKRAHVLVTHGSNACFEAVVSGVPCIILGDAVAKPMSSTELDFVDNPRLASDKERNQWLSDLAYCQWTLAELASGEAWSYIKLQVYA